VANGVKLGRNGARVRLWKVELQKLADETGLVIHVHHYPLGTSKWNAADRGGVVPLGEWHQSFV
jgi:Rhodopirellula transposase DDE domain